MHHLMLYYNSSKFMSVSIKSQKNNNKFGRLRGSIVFGIPAVVILEIVLIYVAI